MSKYICDNCQHVFKEDEAVLMARYNNTSKKYEYEYACPRCFSYQIHETRKRKHYKNVGLFASN